MNGSNLEPALAAVALAVFALAGAMLLVWGSVVRPRVGLYLMLALAPTQFIFMPLSDFFVSPADLIVLAGTAGLAWRLAHGGRRTVWALRLHVWLGVMIAAYLLGFVVLDHFSRTLVRIPMAIVPSVLACELLVERRHFARALAALVAAGAVDAAYGSYFLAIGQPLHPSRFSGMMGVNFSAIVILSAAAIGFARFARTTLPLKLAIPGALTLAGLATLSKMGIVALGTAWVVMIWPVATRMNRRLAAAVAVVVVAGALSQDLVRERLLAGGERTSTDVRVLILRSAWRGLAEQPLLGVGYYEFEKYSRTDPEIRVSTGGAGYGTHNTYLEILVEGGLLAFIPFLLHFLAFARGFPRAWDAVARRHDVIVAGALAGLIVVTICAAVANVLLHYLFWGTCGVALAVVERLETETPA